MAEVRRRLAAGREGNFVAELGGPELGYVLYWAKLQETAPADPADERYLVDEVRPTGLGPDGALVWEIVPDGRTDVVAWNLAEAIDRTHRLAADEVVLVREELDRGSPSEFRAIFFRPVGSSGGGSRMCRIESYDSYGGTYTVQPVAWANGAWQDDGDEIAGVPNVGEVRDAEAGYLAGPSSHTIYARLYAEGEAYFLAVHPPRMT